MANVSDRVQKDQVANHLILKSYPITGGRWRTPAHMAWADTPSARDAQSTLKCGGRPSSRAPTSLASRSAFSRCRDDTARILMPGIFA
jgi:hypothetical protein